MDFAVKQAVRLDSERICELFTEMLRAIYGGADGGGYEDGYGNR